MSELYSSGLLLLLAQIACMIHLFRNGRSWLWLLALFLVPLIGVIAYVLVEVLGRAGDKRDGSGVELRSDEPRRPSIRQLERELEDSPTVENRARLARACLARGQAQRAVPLYEECLTGIYRDDLTLWYEAAEAYHAVGDGAKALDALQRLDEGDYSDYRERRSLLRALALERVGRREEARDALADIARTSSSVQARYEYARILIDLGAKDEAERVVADLFRRRARHDRRFRQREAQWYRAARKLPVNPGI